MQITYACPHCDGATRASFDETTTRISCTRCSGTTTISRGAVAGQHISRCLVCPSTELFVRKDFSQRIGVTIIAVGFAASSVAWFYHRPLLTFAILFASALLDVAFYFLTGELVQCYRCHAEYRGLAREGEHQPFSLETHERYRQQAARLAEHAGSSAGRPAE